MRIQLVTAHAFGPLREAELKLAEGMTVVVGDNESGKSSWHAAVFAALCGRRRGPGQSSKDERRFVDLHKPWDHDDWRVSAQISLDNGRRIELRHDLAGKVACQARDLDLGQDVSSEVMHEGSPDGSRWLGLNRSTFVATACIKQTQLLDVLKEAGGLQQHLQAAATAGTDATTAAALTCLEKFQGEQVGTERANSTKPLRRAMKALEHAELTLKQIRHDHDEYLDRMKRLDDLRKAAAAADAQVRAHEATAEDASLARQITEASAAWRSMPSQPLAPSRTSQQLREELSALSAPAEGDLEEHPNVRRALERTQHGQAQLELWERDRPPDHPPAVPNVVATDDEVIDLARVLETPLPDLTPIAGVTTPADPPRRRMATALLVAGALVAVIGVLLLVTNSSAVGIAGIVLGAALLVGGAVMRQRRHDGVDPSDRDAARGHAAEATRRRDQAAKRCRELGVAADPMLLRGIPKKRAQVETLQRWEQCRTELHREVMAAAGELARALAEQGHPSDGLDAPMLVAAAERYRDACRVRASLAAQARAARDEQERNRAGHLVVVAARACSLPAQTPQEAAAALEEWLVQLPAAEKAPELAAAVDWTLLVSVDEATVGDRLSGLRQAALAAQTEAATVKGELSELAERIGSVAEAEEEWEAATIELKRVQALRQTLDLTRGFLEAAQKSVHREIAPTLVQNVKRWLPLVTGGRYTDVMVNPTNLRVEVRGPMGNWRSAGLLSHGTAEQIYLLLRVALADHLTSGHDTCPLLLDDVTVHADAARTRDILNMLLHLSTERQIVVFTQEEQVAAWARQHLTGPEHTIVTLSPVAVV